MEPSKPLTSQQDTCRWPPRLRPVPLVPAAAADQPVLPMPAAVCEKLVGGGAPHRMIAGKHSNKLSALALLGSLALPACALSGCGRGPQARGAGPAAAAGRPTKASAAQEVEIGEDPVKTGIEAGDASLAGRVRAQLAGDPQLRPLRIEVDAEAGRVTLWGRVGRAEERAAAERQARRTPGVTSVINLIKIADQ